MSRRSGSRRWWRSTGTLRLSGSLAVLSFAAATLAAGQTSSSLAVTERPDSGFAQPLPIDRGAAGLAETLRKLGTRASLIQINAHPDDEDGGMLTYESRAIGADVSLLSLNRGEGGQNVMTGDFWDALGILRTQEHLAANRYYDVHLFYTRVADFGFSKTLEEAMKQWNHDRVLADVVRVVRTARPLVVTSVFAGNVSDGHGHHQASGVLAQEVYNAAADPAMFPEQIRSGLRPWAPLKVYARVPFARATERGIFDYATGHWEPVHFRNYATGKAIVGVPDATVEVPEGEYNALYGRSYLQVAREGLNEQKSQNGGVAIPPAGRFDSPYHLYASRVSGASLPTHEASFFDGIDTSIEGIASYLPGQQATALRAKLHVLQADVAEAAAHYNANDLSQSAPALARGLDHTRALLAEISAGKPLSDAQYNVAHELRLKQDQFNLALGQALGMSLQAVVTAANASAQRIGPPGPVDAAAAAAGSAAASQTAVIGEPLLVAVQIADQGRAPVTISSVALQPTTGTAWKLGGGGELAGALAAGAAKGASLTATVPADATPTQPYFSRPTLEQSFYDIHDSRFLTLPLVPYPLAVSVLYTVGGTQAELRGVVQTAHRAAGQGIVLEPLVVAPAISVRVSPTAGVTPLRSATLPLEVVVHSSVKGPAEGTVDLKLPAGWTATPAVGHFHTEHDNEDVNLHFDVTPENVQPKPYDLEAVATYAGQRFAQGFRTIGYTGIRPYPQYTAASFRTTGVDVKTAPGLRVAHIMGTGEEVPASLRDLGLNVAELTPADVTQGDLRGFDCVIIGIRAYAVRPELRVFNQRLLEYVRNGGVVLTEYQTSEFDGSFSPYPLSVPGDAEKVVEEDAHVTLLKPDDPAFTWPNRIGPQDFTGWVEERGHGFLRSYDPHYTALTEVHDAGQEPQTGGLVYARYGKGYYVYLSYAFFREIPEGVPGSFRIMANLLSLSKNPGLPH